MAELRDSCLPALEHWGELPRDQRRVIARAFIDRIEVDNFVRDGLQLVIYWRDRSIDELRLARKSKRHGVVSSDWRESEVEQLLYLVDSGATQLELVATFPNRNWQSIRHRLWRIRGKACVEALEPKPVRDYETYAAYLERKTNSQITHATAAEKWGSDEEEHLLQLVDAGATQVELAEAFPLRRWWRIRWKITQMRGGGIKIPEVGKIQRNETIADYRSRIGEPDLQSTVAVQSVTPQPDCLA
jgi:hypothetical protein